MKIKNGLSGGCVLLFCVITALPLFAQRGGDSPVREYGVVESAKQFSVRAPFDTTLLFLVAEGASVKKGDLIVEYDPSEIKAKLDAQKIQLAVQESVLQAETEALARATAGAQDKLQLFQTRLSDAQKTLKEYSNEGKGEAANILRSKEIELELCNNKVAFARNELQKIASPTKFDLQQAQMMIQKAELESALAKNQMERFKLFESPQHIRQLSNAVLEAKMELNQIEMDSAAAIDKSKKRLIQLKSEYEIGKAKRRRLENQIEQTRVVAEAGGIAIYTKAGSRATTIEVGTKVRTRQNVLMIADPSSVKMAVLVNETRVRRLKPGQSAQAKLDAGGPKLTGTVSKISSTPEPVTFLGANVTKYRVEVLLNDAGNDVRIGMTGMVEFQPLNRSK